MKKIFFYKIIWNIGYFILLLFSYLLGFIILVIPPPLIAEIGMIKFSSHDGSFFSHELLTRLRWIILAHLAGLHWFQSSSNSNHEFVMLKIIYAISVALQFFTCWIFLLVLTKEETNEKSGKKEKWWNATLNSRFPYSFKNLNQEAKMSILGADIALNVILFAFLFF